VIWEGISYYLKRKNSSAKTWWQILFFKRSFKDNFCIFPGGSYSNLYNNIHKHNIKHTHYTNKNEL
jgi:hypothetical protein